MGVIEMERRGRSPAGHQQGAAAGGALDCNAPLRSMRGGVAPSPFYKLSAELSKESLRVPGAVPFQWEQAPGRRKTTGNSPLHSTPPRPFAIAHLPPTTDPAVVLKAELSPNTDSPIVHNSPTIKDPPPAPPLKPSLAALFRQNSSPSMAPPPPLPPPACANSHRSSSSRFPIGSSTASAAATPLPPPAPLSSMIPAPATTNHSGGGDDDGQGDDLDADAASDAAFTTATAGLSTFDDACSNLGAPAAHQAPAAAQYGRDLILHRFLPAAHAIACDSPQTPSRRYAIISSSSAADPPCADSCLQPIITLRRLPRTPLAVQLVHEDVDDQLHDHDLSRSHSATSMKACGLFPLGIRSAFLELFFRLSLCRSKSQQQDVQHVKLLKKQKKKTAAASSASVPRQRRLADILREDDSDQCQSYQFYQQNNLSNTASPMEGTLTRLIHQGRSLPHPSESSYPLTHDDAASSYYDASGRFSPNILAPACYSNDLSYNVAKAGAMSPFPEGKGFLGLPKDHYQRANSNNNQGSTPYETQARITVSEYCSKLAAEMDGRYAIGSTRSEYSPRSPRIGRTADNSTQICPRSKQCSYANSADHQYSNGASMHAELNAADQVTMATNMGKARGSNGRPMNNPQCSEAVPIFNNGRRPNSPSRFCRKQPEAAPLIMSSCSPSPARQAYPSAAHTQPTAYSSCGMLLSPPPLPKSPSESWLWKAIPVSASNPKPLSNKSSPSKLVNSGSPPQHISDDFRQDGSKWEIIVKGSCVQTGHLRFSEELFHHNQDNDIKVGST